jgi:hypothetical protein
VQVLVHVRVHVRARARKELHVTTSKGVSRSRVGGHTASRVLSLAAVALLLAAGGVRAQDSNYWDSQYGTKSELLGGLVVGAPTDLSATYYNPAWIAIDQAPSLLLTTRAVERYSVKLKNALGTANDIETSTIGTSPGYLAGRFSLGDDRGWNWAYTYLEKVRFRYDSNGSILALDRAAPPDGLTWASLEAFVVSDIGEAWYGVSMSRKTSDRVAIGFSTYLAHRSQRSRVEIAGQTMTGAGASADLNLVEDYRFAHLRLLVKAGLALNGDWWTAGLTVTTPGLGLMGTGEVYERLFTSGGYDPADPGATAPYRIHVTAEWFDAVGRFAVLDPAPYEVQTDPGVFESYDLSYAAESLVNYGVGVERIFSPSFSLFTSYRLDQTATPPDKKSRLAASSWDLHHVTGGASFQLLNMEFTTGLQFSWGESSELTRLDVDSGLDDPGVLDGERSTLEFRRLKALLGFNLPFSTPGQ